MTLIDYYEVNNSRSCTFSIQLFLIGIVKRDDRFANAVCFVSRSQQAW